MTKIKPKLVFPFAIGEKLWEARGNKYEDNPVHSVDFFMLNRAIGDQAYRFRFSVLNEVLDFPPKTKKQRDKVELLCKGFAEIYLLGLTEGREQGRRFVSDEIKKPSYRG